MLIGFSFKNFKSFYDESIFSLASSKKEKRFKEINTFLVNDSDDKSLELLKSAFIFGANASGKTNVISAISYMRMLVLTDFTRQNNLIENVDTFAFVDDNIPASFEVNFIIDKIEYRYGFEILNKEIISEYLYRKDKREVEIFSRSGDKIKLTAQMGNVKNLVNNVRKDNLFLSWANTGKNEIAMNIVDWFKNLTLISRNIEENMESLSSYTKKSDYNKNKIVDFVKLADPNIAGIDFEEKNLEEADRDIRNKLETILNIMLPAEEITITNALYTYKMYNSKWEEIGTAKMLSETESAGTQKILKLSLPILEALEKGNIVIIDEIDSNLHPLLVKYLVNIFNSIEHNPNNAQLICTTHNPLLLEENLRRDQIYFTEKDNYGRSSLYSIVDFARVRKDTKIFKQYLLGVYGATPILSDYVIYRKGKE